MSDEPLWIRSIELIEKSVIKLQNLSHWFVNSLCNTAQDNSGEPEKKVPLAAPGRAS